MMWKGSRDRKCVFTLNIDNYAPDICKLTYPLIQYYANRIDAAFHVIDQRKFPAWPVTYEKLQIHDLMQEMELDWAIYIDSDALIHPETLDFTQHIAKDTVVHHGIDMASIRWRYDRYFRRDGRNIGSCNWFTIASDWCLDLWKPLDDLTVEEAVSNIQPTVGERISIITPEHLIDDYALSRNIAKYGLKFKTVKEILKEVGLHDANLFWHLYTISVDEKVKQMQDTLKQWNMTEYFDKVTDL